MSAVKLTSKLRKAMTKLQHFRLALTVSGVTAIEFAQKLKVSRQMVYGVIAKNFKSRRVEAAVDHFIRKHSNPNLKHRGAK